MQERTALEDQLTAIGRIQQELDDQLMMIELGETEKDQKAIGDAEEALKRFPAEILEQQRGPAAFAHEVKRSRSPSRVKLIFQPVLVRKAIERQRRWTLRHGILD